MTDLGSIYGTTVGGSNTLVIDFSNVDICGNLNINGGLAIDNSFGLSGQVLTSNGSSSAPSWANQAVYMCAKANAFQAAQHQPYTISDWNTNLTIESESGLFNNSVDVFTAPSDGVYSVSAHVTIFGQNHTYSSMDIHHYQSGSKISTVMRHYHAESNDFYNQGPGTYRNHSGTTLVNLTNADTLRMIVQGDNTVSYGNNNTTTSITVLKVS